MQEVMVKLKFLTPCLGGVRCADFDRMERDSEGKVIFLQRWWNKLVEYGGQANGVARNVLQDIRFDPIVDGAVTQVKRYFGGADGSAFKMHEAFDKDAVVGINAMLPDGLDIDRFKKVLGDGGRYVGISPYGHDKGFGRFTVEGIYTRTA